jgi:hypothetical protein
MIEELLWGVRIGLRIVGVISPILACFLLVGMAQRLINMIQRIKSESYWYHRWIKEKR